ncbi:hypothetical protein EXIGLDRAFT_674856, partial [Exidia glandulosa HHB12029]
MSVTTLPSSMRELRRPRRPDHLLDPARRDWVPFEAFFIANGITLWRGTTSSFLVPPDLRPRAPDGFAYYHPDMLEGPPRKFSHLYADLCPGRTIDGRDVMIRIVSIGDEKSQQQIALERLASGNVASVIGNHAIPVLQWLKFENVTFAILPYLSIADPTGYWPWENVDDLFDSLTQMIEAVEFCHSKLVAHRDLFHGNFLSNFAGGATRKIPTLYDIDEEQLSLVKPLRSLFPFRIYLIDFELAMCFEEGSNPDTHVARGRPVEEVDGVTYARPVAPEMDLDAPYNVFKADVWQLGKCFLRLPVAFDPMSSELATLIARMTAVVPADRPSAREALNAIREIRARLSLEQLRARPTYRPIEEDEW